MESVDAWDPLIRHGYFDNRAIMPNFQVSALRVLAAAYSCLFWNDIRKIGNGGDIRATEENNDSD